MDVRSLGFTQLMAMDGTLKQTVCFKISRNTWSYRITSRIGRKIT